MARGRTTSGQRRAWAAAIAAAVAGLSMAVGRGGDSRAVEPEPPPSTSATAEPPPGTSSSTSTPSTSLAGGPIAARLAALPIKGRAPMTGYDRALFGQAWSDAPRVSGGRNGCDQRNDVLRRDLDPVEIKPGTNGCVAIAGELLDPYSGTSLDFERGPRSAEVPVDHVVPLGNAWATGAQQITSEQREALANDPLNLQPTSRSLNAQKSDGDAATWLPPAKTYRCTYVSRQIEVKVRYRLWVTAPEKKAMERVLSGCPDQRLDPAKWDVPQVSR